MKKLAFFGAPGSGKTTLSKAMVRYFGGTILSLAQSLRLQVSQQYQIPFSQLVQTPQKYSHREILQSHGSMRRAQNTSYWTQLWMEQYDRRISFGDKTFFVDDVRYQNEFKMLKDLGFTMIFCEANPEENSTITVEESRHESEQDWKIFNPDLQLKWEITPQIRATTLILREASLDRKKQ